MSDFQVIATVNTHLLRKATLEDMVARGATILRLNGSHILPAELGHYAAEIRGALGNRVKILLDLPGRKIRTAVFPEPIVLTAGSTFDLRADELNYPGFLALLAPGDVLLANDSLFRFRVETVAPDHATLVSFTDGLLTSNKGIHLVGRPLSLPFFFDRDRELVVQAVRNRLDYVGLSFVQTASDVDEARAALAGSGVVPIVKIETAQALDHLDEILARAEEFLVDRGDLSCDVGVEHIDRLQKLVLRCGKRAGKKVYFATQFLHSMVHNNLPLIAEACGLSDAIRCGVDGIQLSEETAIGKHPLETLDVVRRIQEASRTAIRLPAMNGRAPVIWLTGRSGSGKTTMARRLVTEIESRGHTCCLIDGDDFRSFWNNEPGYTREDRIRNQRNIAFTAYQASGSFDLVIVSSLSPYRELREFARTKISGFHEIYVDCPQEICRARDPKGHYRKAAAGGHEHFVGVSEEYEVPDRPEFVVNTGALDLDGSVAALRDYLFVPGAARHGRA